MVPSGSIVTYVGQWSTTFSQSASDVIQAVVTGLNGAGLPVKQQSNTATFLQSGLEEPFSVTLQMQVDGLGYNSPDDVISIVRHQVYLATGKFPFSDSLPYVQAPGATVKATGQPGQTAPQTGCVAGSSSDLTGAFSFSCWFKNLTTTGFASVGALALIVVLGIGVAFYFGIRPKSA